VLDQRHEPGVQQASLDPGVGGMTGRGGWRLGYALREAYGRGPSGERRYTRGDLRADVLAGIVVGIVALPLAMALSIACKVALPGLASSAASRPRA
jgi:hypothetical protein